MKTTKEYISALDALDEDEFSSDLTDYAKLATLVYASNDLIDTGTSEEVTSLCEEILSDFMGSYGISSSEKIKALIYILSKRVFSDIIGDDNSE